MSNPLLTVGMRGPTLAENTAGGEPGRSETGDGDREIVYYFDLQSERPGRDSYRRGQGDQQGLLEAPTEIGVTVSGILVNELGTGDRVVSVDGLELSELDFVDVGEVIRPANVVPVVIKSLIFPEPVVEGALPS